MKIYINNNPEDISLENPTLQEILLLKEIPSSGTAVAINNKLVRHADWTNTIINTEDSLTIISAAFGG
ncbi:MAG: sulfur carrier protein ThiS [Roseburia sp.]|nr:sulfur carrier protein ThiS [Roseburia sp.]